MNTVVDYFPWKLLGERRVNQKTRYYYLVDGYPNLLLVSQDNDLGRMQGKSGISLFNSSLGGALDTGILCDVVPNAPQEWRGHVVTQATFKVVPKTGNGTPLSKVLARNAAKYKYRPEDDEMLRYLRTLARDKVKEILEGEVSPASLETAIFKLSLFLIWRDGLSSSEEIASHYGVTRKAITTRAKKIRNEVGHFGTFFPRTRYGRLYTGIEASVLSPGDSGVSIDYDKIRGCLKGTVSVNNLY